MRVSSASLSQAVVREGSQFVKASSIAWDVFSSSVRSTEALEIWPRERAVAMDDLKERRWERRWIMGQRVVERPRRVSTALRGVAEVKEESGKSEGKGVVVGRVVVLGDVPRERAAITS